MDHRDRIRDRARGCLLAGALGDALGGPLEFLALEHIQRRWPDGPELDDLGLITDDTQMTLFTADALIRSALGGDRLEQLWAAYQRWLLTQGPVDPMPTTDDWLSGHRQLWESRAPGATCVSALRGNQPGRTDAPLNHSKGCGGVMRAAPAGFLPDPDTAYQVGCELSAITHGHPSGWISGGALALLVHLVAVADQPVTVAVREVTSRVAAEPDGSEVRDALAVAVDAARRMPGDIAMLATLGEGWVAEEALAIGGYAVLSHPTDIRAALRLAVRHSGDSDSTGAIAGNIIGAALGTAALPTEWLARLELADLIGTVADDLVDAYAGDLTRLVDRYS